MKKTKIMWFGVNNDNNDNKLETIDISGIIMEKVCSYPYVGVEFDSLLSFD